MSPSICVVYIFKIPIRLVLFIWLMRHLCKTPYIYLSLTSLTSIPFNCIGDKFSRSWTLQEVVLKATSSISSRKIGFDCIRCRSIFGSLYCRRSSYLVHCAIWVGFMNSETKSCSMRGVPSSMESFLGISRHVLKTTGNKEREHRS